jgi:CheY-like chemotaxis protein
MHDERMEAALDAAKAARAENAKPLQILLVDADASFRTRLARKLSEEGHVVVSFSNCNDAWLRARQSNFDLTLIDIEVPAMTGIELARRIKFRDKHSRIIATTPNSVRNNMWASSYCKVNGFEHLLSKEGDFHSLYNNLRSLVSTGVQDNAGAP